MVDTIQQLVTEARERQILDAATTVFAAKGFQAATIQDIAREAGIAAGTIYNYFDNKPALLLGIFERLQRAILQGEGTLPGEGVALYDAVKALVSYPLTALEDDDFALFRIVLSQTMINETLRGRYHERILAPALAAGDGALQAQAAAEGLAMSGEEARLVVRILAATVMGLMVAHVLGDETVRARWDDLPDTLATLVVNGIRATGQ
jgi:AcrR family transcriptional regulator